MIVGGSADAGAGAIAARVGRCFVVVIVVLWRAEILWYSVFVWVCSVVV